LGELTAKALAAGGGKVIITYAVGRAEAACLAQEILEWGGICSIVHYDIRLPAKGQIEDIIRDVTHVYYFATPAIFRAKGSFFAAERFAQFSEYYIKGFSDLCFTLREALEGSISVFYPSSVAIEQRPPEMTEYAMAKSAGEVLCADINRFLPGVKVIVKRLPRMDTDQTATVVPVKKTDSVEILLPIVREMCSASPQRN
jgi:NAD(P)-dependent dehydrogenase (short-subunit alcohol dehydrogenase family)